MVLRKRKCPEEADTSRVLELIFAPVPLNVSTMRIYPMEQTYFSYGVKSSILKPAAYALSSLRLSNPL